MLGRSEAQLTKAAAVAVTEGNAAERRTLLQIVVGEHRQQIVVRVLRAVSAQPTLRDEAISFSEDGVITCRDVVIEDEHRLYTNIIIIIIIVIAISYLYKQLSRLKVVYSYGASPAIWDHTMPPDTRRR